MTSQDGRKLTGCRILVVEDDGLIAFHTADVLRSWGCVVLGPAATASAALVLLQTQAPDAAILDVQLRDGLSTPVAEALDERDIPYLLVTALSPGELPRNVREAPRLQKPWDEWKLRVLLADLVRN